MGSKGRKGYARVGVREHRETYRLIILYAKNSKFTIKPTTINKLRGHDIMNHRDIQDLKNLVKDIKTGRERYMDAHWQLKTNAEEQRLLQPWNFCITLVNHAIDRFSSRSEDITRNLIKTSNLKVKNTPWKEPKKPRKKRTKA